MEYDPNDRTDDDDEGEADGVIIVVGE